MQNPFDKKWFRWGLTGCFGVPIIIHIFNLQFSRLVADDYDYARVLANEGLFGSVRYWYEQWTGNYSSSFFQSLFMLAGVNGMRLLLVSLLVIWWVVIVWLVYEVILRLNMLRPRFLAVFMGTFILFATMDGLPNIFDSLYWGAGAIAHVIPLVGFSFFLCLFLWTTRKHIQGLPYIAILLFTGAFTLINAGFSPVSTAYQVVVLLLLMGVYWRTGEGSARRQAIMMLGVALAACLAALVIINSAPGGEIRQSYFPPTPDLANFVRLTLLYTVAFISAAVIILEPFSILLAILLGGLVAYYLQPTHPAIIRKHNLRLLGLVFLVGSVMIAACFSTGAYAMSTYLPARANTTPAFTITVMALLWGYLMGANLRKGDPRAPRKVVFYVLAVLLIAAPGWMLFNTLRLTPRLASYASDWDAIDQQLKAAGDNGEQVVEVDGYSTFDLGELIVDKPLSDDPNASANRSMAQYYGVQAVIGPPLEIDEPTSAINTQTN